MKNTETVLYQVTETSKYMMAFVIVTKNDNVIVIDGGRPADMPLVKKYIGGRHISAWILTHPHDDHISGFMDEIDRNGGQDFDIERVVYNFPPYSLVENKNVPDYEYYQTEFNECLPDFERIMPEIKDISHVVKQGESMCVDEVKIDFIYTWHEGLTANPMNDASLVFRLSTPDTSVLFLGDLGPDAGDILFRESRHLLKSSGILRLSRSMFT